METGEKIILFLKVVIFSVVAVAAYQWYTGDKSIQHKAVALLTQSGATKKMDIVGRKTAAVYNKVLGDDLKKTGDAVGHVKEQLKAAEDLAKKQEAKLHEIENR